MKKIYVILIAIIMIFGSRLNAQVSVTTDGSPADASAMLDVKSSNKGMLMPRMTTAEMNGISGPATGLMVFNTSVNKVYFYNGSAWSELGGSMTIPVGLIQHFGGSTAPAGFLICDGSEVSRTTYADLFAVIGITYGAGDGSTTFNLPNLKGKVPVGLNSGESEFNVLGETGGEKTHTLTIAEMPVHDHLVDPPATTTSTDGGHAHNYTTPLLGAYTGLVHDVNGTAVEYPNYNGGATTSNGLHAHTVNISPFWSNYQGNGNAHNNLQPYIVLNYIIKY